MGSFSFLSINNYPTFSTKNDYYDEIVNALFQPEDYLIEERPLTSRNRLYWGDAYDGHAGKYTFKGFQQSASICKRRLEIYGISIATIRNEWSKIRKTVNNGYHMSDYDFPLQKVSFLKYYQELTNILKNKIINYEQERNSLQNTLIADELVMQGLRITSALYALISSVNDSDIIEYDLTEVIDSGWVTRDPPSNISIEKIIILTEGKTDVKILKDALKILNPEIAPYYHFMDFEGLKPEGGASALVRTIKSFVGANVKHPVIGIFDNDTAGIGEMNKIPAKLPDNIRCLKLPDINIARKFPTIGPAGFKLMNVNGLACGIEIYLGTKILMDEGKYAQIRWTNYDSKLEQYHGSFVNKEELHKRFDKMVAAGIKWDMPEMELVLSSIFNALRLTGVKKVTQKN